MTYKSLFAFLLVLLCTVSFSAVATDTDGDGMPDSYEASYSGLDPNTADGDQDPDEDGLSNYEEFQQGSPPDVADTSALYVADNGFDVPSGGGVNTPYQTITYAISQLPSTPEFQSIIVLKPGTYTENITMPMFLTIRGSLQADSIIVGVITGNYQCDLNNIKINVPAGASVGLSISDSIMKLKNVEITGASTVSTVGISMSNLLEGDTIFDGCTFQMLKTGIEIYGFLPTIRRCEFYDFSYAAIDIKAAGKSAVSKSLGDAEDPTSGFNTFQYDTGVYAVVSARAETIKMQQNDWGTDDDAEIVARASGNVDVSVALPAGSAILASSVFCTVWDGTLNQPITTASVQLTPSSYGVITDNVNGVYSFPIVSAGNFTVQASATGYADGSSFVSVSSGEQASVLIDLSGSDTGGGSGCQQFRQGGPATASIVIESAVVLLFLAAARRKRGH